VTAPWVGASLVSVIVGATMWSGGASASAPAVTIPRGPFSDRQTITVSGTGFPAPSQDPSGVQILQCSDPGGLSANLPTDPSSCDGATVNPLPVRTDSGGNFSVHYVVSALSMRFGTSNINCDATNFCVLWAGEDYNQAFTSGTHAFSTPFEVDAPAAAVSGGGVTPPVASTVPPSAVAAPASGVGSVASVPTPVLPTATPALATTGTPARLPQLVTVALVLGLLGTLGRRMVRRYSSIEGADEKTA
jgi:hypothetical protein